MEFLIARYCLKLDRFNLPAIAYRRSPNLLQLVERKALMLRSLPFDCP